ncbi:Quercetin 2,3-dioxygenase [Botrimarina colliarenosi]|uniref:Quercetin 2,3-dioxygenase n=1 Tax=Botrimarina colliarenosi TaxID=2528001 RepID=A0A5C6A796_9BACT|nr:pirin family protein [Botrimarina colliarenosi]TWT95247.1 Quercetin 2,3-dioxygenase [Botrimarina colliarenosi]
MIRHRQASDRGHADHGWLDSHHTFSFAGYHDPEHMGFRALRVVNDDRVAAGQGFGSHPHRDMEILSYVLEGQLEHRDNLGNGAVIGPGEFQRITAGAGVVHSEFNPAADAPVHFYQVWIKPRAHGLPAGYEELRSVPDPRDRLVLVASPDGRDGSLTIQQDAEVWLGRLDAGVEVVHPIEPGRGVWVQVLSGAATVGGIDAAEGDGFAVEDETSLAIHTAGEGAQVLLFDLP